MAAHHDLEPGMRAAAGLLGDRQHHPVDVGGRVSSLKPRAQRPFALMRRAKLTPPQQADVAVFSRVLCDPSPTERHMYGQPPARPV
ncbi:MAG TPA: hypothetical protein PLE61_03220 [Vicinamibacterales bacterium]|nr:hypothetical protein [Vicinamibacterales bacterium]